jgi:hypothetical protein
MVTIEGITYISPPEAEEELAIPRSTVYNWVRTGAVPILDLALANELKDRGLVDSMYLIPIEELRAKHKEVHLET